MPNSVRIISRLFLIIGIAYLNLSCFCRGPELSEYLIKGSDIIFEGRLIKTDTLPQDDNNDDLILTFKPLKIFKGEKQNHIILKSSLSSCGFIMFYESRQRDIGNTFLIYSNKINGYYRYATCSNRRVFKFPRKYPHNNMSLEKEYKREVIKYDSIYKREVTKLDSMLKN